MYKKAISFPVNLTNSSWPVLNCWNSCTEFPFNLRTHSSIRLLFTQHINKLHEQLHLTKQYTTYMRICWLGAKGLQIRFPASQQVRQGSGYPDGEREREREKENNNKRKLQDGEIPGWLHMIWPSCRSSTQPININRNSISVSTWSQKSADCVWLGDLKNSRVHFAQLAVNYFGEICVLQPGSDWGT